jgi:hypothetical protein
VNGKVARFRDFVDLGGPEGVIAEASAFAFGTFPAEAGKECGRGEAFAR